MKIYIYTNIINKTSSSKLKNSMTNEKIKTKRNLRKNRNFIHRTFFFKFFMQLVVSCFVADESRGEEAQWLCYTHTNMINSVIVFVLEPSDV